MLPPQNIFHVGYNNWFLVGIYITLLGVFLYGILRPRSRVEWRSAGIAQAWVIALYAEMYGLPLTMYGLAWLTGRTEYAHDHFHGHAWAYLFGFGDKGAIATDVIGQLFIITGAVLALASWRQVYRAQAGLVTTGLYRYVRHPQYTGFFLFLIGSLVNWPTLITLAMFPFLVMVYYRLAKAEETEARARLGDDYAEYCAVTGMFLPRFLNYRTAAFPSRTGLN
jgi:methanethiol S-methyltransferase